MRVEVIYGLLSLSKITLCQRIFKYDLRWNITSKGGGPFFFNGKIFLDDCQIKELVTELARYIGRYNSLILVGDLS